MSESISTTVSNPTPERAAESAPAAGSEGFNYPASTPVADMTPDQAAEYWREKAQKHEKLWRDVKSTDLAEAKRQLKALERERDGLRQASMTEQEKAVATAVAEARTSTLREIGTHLVVAEFRAQAAGRLTPEQVAELTEDLDMTKYLTESGEVDAERVAKKVDALAPKPTTDESKPTWPDLGQGARDSSTLALNDDGLTAALERAVGARRR
jgi:hypothetical protein